MCRFRAANNVRAVQITNGQYRSATVSGVFELYNPERNDPVEVKPGGKKQVQVICAWYGGKPNKKSGARIDVTSSACRFKVLDSFSGQVADSIGRAVDPSSTVDDTSPFPDEIAASEHFWEGALQRITVNAYERDPAARRACIAHFEKPVERAVSTSQRPTANSVEGSSMFITLDRSVRFAWVTPLTRNET